MTKLILITGALLALGFFLGWIFPVEGPVDYVYDNYKAQKSAVKNCPRIVTPTELSEEELDFLEELYEKEIMRIGD